MEIGFVSEGRDPFVFEIHTQLMSTKYAFGYVNVKGM